MTEGNPRPVNVVLGASWSGEVLKQRMRISDDYFRRLLDDFDPLEAVFRLDELWCARDGVDEGKPYFGLAEPEFNAHMYLLYQGDVNNGGHCQFFINPSASYCDELVRSLQALGLSDIVKVFASARAVFPDSIVPRDHSIRRQYINALPESALQKWSELDREFYKVDGDSLPVVHDYLRAHQEYILIPERA